MAGLVPAIHVCPLNTEDVDARDKRGHDGSQVRHGCCCRRQQLNIQFDKAGEKRVVDSFVARV
jgi:hypothetical protein